MDTLRNARALFALVAVLVVALVVAGQARAADPLPRLSITGRTSYPAYELVSLDAKDAPKDAALLWRVEPSDKVHRAATARGRLEFSAPPGRYRVELLAVGLADGKVVADQAVTTVTIAPPISGSNPPGPGTPPGGDSPPSYGRNQIKRALCRIQFGSAGCTATVVAPRRADGRYDLLTANHCIPGVGARGVAMLSDGRRVSVVVTAANAQADLAWLLTDDAGLGELPTAELAPQMPEPGSKVWHAGFGIDRPGNEEDGELLASPRIVGRETFRLSVSSGDSGGGIFDARTNRLLAAVCCTTGKGARVVMFGGGCTTAARMRPKGGPVGGFDWFEPVGLPVIDGVE